MFYYFFYTISKIFFSFNSNLENLEMAVSKIYNPSGIVSIIILFQNFVYMSIVESNGENPLLDSHFPDVSGRGRGYQLEVFADSGPSNFKELRKVSIWQTQAALQEEIEERARLDDEKNSPILLITNSNDSKESNTNAIGDLLTSNASTRTDNKEISANTKQAKSSKSTSDSKDQKVETREHSSPDRFDNVSQSENTNNTEDSTENDPFKMSTFKQALPHHIPRDTLLASKLESLRTSLGDQGLVAPWDSKGRPLALGAARK